MDGFTATKRTFEMMPDLLTLIPCIRDMARRGLSALSVRIVLKAWIPPAPQSEAIKLMRDTYFDYYSFAGEDNDEVN